MPRATVRDDIGRWLQNAPAGSTHMVVMADRWDWTDYPVYFESAAAARQRVDHPGTWEKPMECYRLADNHDEQIGLRRCWRF